jgi:hypothetical protein
MGRKKGSQPKMISSSALCGAHLTVTYVSRLGDVAWLVRMVV